MRVGRRDQGRRWERRPCSGRRLRRGREGGRSHPVVLGLGTPEEGRGFCIPRSRPRKAGGAQHSGGGCRVGRIAAEERLAGASVAISLERRVPPGGWGLHLGPQWKARRESWAWCGRGCPCRRDPESDPGPPDAHLGPGGAAGRGNHAGVLQSWGSWESAGPALRP